ncbi:relaxase/mobilization nuclease domain-containing protein [Roseobacter sp. OBYS 0001]|uniref:relaxase/mobilization nuclease domain-containing protein n=1 Tax=Roseobacter sp. OBYS 0001 TaxID=882651 RepID=UPI001BBA0FF8|nr:relaxase/mobilization nuclease domain-containing protein [Roseobacter sp. OBYS 0001]GIT88729.1 hypothetical protein ROBYS_37450 [Roseobacter sp. OBYS 0001]
MPLNDAIRAAAAVHDVTGEVFREGWSRIRGSMQGLHVKKQRQLIRAAAGHRAAVFKAIRGGGTHSKSELSNQLGYLTTKSTHIVDSSGFLDGKAKLNNKEIKELTERFAKRWSAGFKPKLGQTTHMLLSYPIGTRGEDVRDITANVAERFFQTDEAHFDYIIAVHEDRAHPHAHIVLNRRSQEGEFFFLGRDHRFNYDDFRLAMVEEAERFGVRLEATRRLDRGVVHYPARTREVYAAKEESRVAAPRPRVGADLERALAEIANTRTVYHALAVEASRDAREDISAALFRAGELLARGGRLNLEGGVYMAEEQSFDDLRIRYADQVARVQGMIAAKQETERPQLERKLNEIQARLAHMQPLGLRSGTLTESPSDGGIYSEAKIDRDQLVRLQESDVRAQIDTALRGTGIRSSVVIARVETGAQNAALERQWIADDLARVAETGGLNLERRADLETAREALNRAHVQVGITLERAAVLREDRVMEGETILERIHYHREAAEAMEQTIRRAMRAEGLTEQQIEDREGRIAFRAQRQIETEQRAYIDAHPQLLARPGDVIDRSEPFREHITDEDRAEEIARDVDRIMAERDFRTPVAEAVTDEFRARYPDMPVHLARGLGATYAAVVEAHNTAAINQFRRETEMRERLRDGVSDTAQGARLARSTRPEVVSQPVDDAELRRVIEHERSGEMTAPFTDTQQRLAYRETVERELDAEQIERLQDGDRDVLREQISDRLDRLYAAKVYLQSDEATANSEAARAVVERDEVQMAEFSNSDAQIIRDVERGVEKQIDRTADEYSYFEKVVFERGRLTNDRPHDGSGVELSAAVLDLNMDRTQGHLDARSAHRAEVLIRDTLQQFGERMERDVEQDYNLRLSLYEDALQMGSDGDRIVTEQEFQDIKSDRDGLRDLFRQHGFVGPIRLSERKEIQRVIDHERAGSLSSLFEDSWHRSDYRVAVERDLNADQINRLSDGDVDVLKEQISDRLDRLYAAKVYLQSDEATANSEAARAVVEEIADREYELQRADLIDGEKERGETH